jgi:hypothetical protein
MHHVADGVSMRAQVGGARECHSMSHQNGDDLSSRAHGYVAHSKRINRKTKPRLVSQSLHARVEQSPGSPPHTSHSPKLAGNQSDTITASVSTSARPHTPQSASTVEEQKKTPADTTPTRPRLQTQPSLEFKESILESTLGGSPSFPTRVQTAPIAPCKVKR